MRNIIAHDIDEWHKWAEQTFGPGLRTDGIVDHIGKELKEIKADPTDVYEWVDVILLAINGATRAGVSGKDLIEAIHAKIERNKARQWPDWRSAVPGTAIEHIRSAD